MSSRPPFAKSFRGKHVLITGGLGFIGSNLARTLVGLGAKVTILDSLIPEYGGNRHNVHGLERKLNVNLADLRDRGLLAYHMNDFSHALRDLEEYLKVARLSEQDEDQKKDTEQVWEHVKTLRRRVAQLN